VRFRDDKPCDLERARYAVAAWREENPSGTIEQLLANVGPQFHPDYAIVLRGVLWMVDRNRARQVAGIVAGQAVASR
jgi:hypothetical protein